MKGVKSGIFHMSGCGIHTRVDANGFTIYRRGCKQFSGGLITAEPTPSGARKDLAGQIVKLAGLEEA